MTKNGKKAETEETKELAPREEAPVPSTQTANPGGMEDFGREDIVIPMIRIVQPTSKEGNQGKFRDNLTGEEFDEIDVVFISSRKGRIMFDKDDLTAGPLCGSDDRKTPSEYFETPMSESCLGCPQAEWVKDDKTGRNTCACSENYTLLGIDIESGMPFFFMTKGTAFVPTKRFLSGIFLRGKKSGLNLWDYATTLTLKETSNAQGKFYVPVFGVPVVEEGRFAAEAEMYKEQRAGYVDPTLNPDEDPDNDENDAIPFD